MSSFQIDILLVALVTAAACALPGVFLVLRRMSMMSDAISHTVLLGIVIGFFLTRDLTSPLLVFGAALVGLLTVGLVALLQRTGLVREDAAIGLVFPALFSLAVILISVYARNVHLDTDAVLVGELAFAPFDRFLVAGVDLGPRGLYLMGGILAANLLFIGLFYKELKLTTFDAGLAAVLGFAPALIQTALLALVSVTVVGAFDIVGSVLVVALMVAPAAAAYLLTDRLRVMIVLSVLLGMLSALAGYGLAHWLDASIAGSIAALNGVVFGLVFLLAPERGMLALARRRARQRWDFAQTMLAIHLLNHEGTADAEQESQARHLMDHLRWDEVFSAAVVRRSVAQGWVVRSNGHLGLTETGRKKAHEALVL